MHRDRLMRGLLAAVVLTLPLSNAASAGDALGYTGLYAVAEIGSLGGTVDVLSGINAAEQVVGMSVTLDGFLHPFLWSNGSPIDLGTLGGNDARPSDRGALNSHGHVVGVSGTAD